MRCHECILWSRAFLSTISRIVSWLQAFISSCVSSNVSFFCSSYGCSWTRGSSLKFIFKFRKLPSKICEFIKIRNLHLAIACIFTHFLSCLYKLFLHRPFLQTSLLSFDWQQGTLHHILHRTKGHRQSLSPFLCNF
jgi:hypothetical protein